MSNILLGVLLAAIISWISIFFYKDLEYQASDPCPAAGENICDVEAEYIGMWADQESYIPFTPVCSCLAGSTRVFFEIGE